MRTIERTGQFKRDFKRELKGRRGNILGVELPTLALALAQDEVLEARFRDHALTGAIAIFGRIWCSSIASLIQRHYN